MESKETEAFNVLKTNPFKNDIEERDFLSAHGDLG